MKIYAFIGVIGSGKDYYATHRLEELNRLGYKGIHINFADAVRKMVWKIFGFEPKDNKEYELFKKTSIEVNLNREENPVITGREFMQKLGTDCIRTSNPDFWANEWKKKIDEISYNYDFVVVSDCRFENEAKIIMENFDSKFIFCNYNSERYELNDHESEIFAQDFLEYDDYTDITSDIKRLIL